MGKGVHHDANNKVQW